ncbi:MAG TPA: hypothetical protein VFE08_09710 [Candidatus Sulfotelmatobacter sp.]|jgi:hypothetical protein|nr:hypothetical protein [Candidatus Sulfotelmatobacter sp.]
MIGIKNIGSRQLEARDLGDSLQFALKRNPRWGNVVAGLIVIGGFTVVAWWRHSVILMVFAVVGMIGLVSNRLRGREPKLRVSRAEVVAQGDLLSSSTEEMTIPLNEITSMGWNAGGQDDSGGLYVANGFTRSYILPGATEAQAREILAAITGRFPGFPIDDKTWASLIWGDESVLMDLGLDEGNQGEGSRSGKS